MEMAERMVLVAYTLNNPRVVRFEPPLTISFEEMDQVVGAMEESLRGVKKIVEEVSE